ncbi:MAG: hypothetical protein ILO36_08950 [Abditibacteriota bacterium]|nr:hypothetical protein [Abditibacteriota bacterium]
MKKFFLIVLLILACAAAFCQQTDTIKFYTTWDDDMLYIAVAAQGPDIRAVHKDFNKPVDGDDGVSVFLNLSEDRSGAAYTDKTALISVSCAGGFEFRRGNGTELVREDIFSHRYAVDVQGNLNDTGNIDSGYSIELALPWALMGGSNMSYKAVGIDFRITVCGKDYYLTDSDSFAKPDKCWDLLLSKFSAVTTKGAHKIVSNHYMAEPRINGEIKENEWYSRTAYVIEVPVDGGDPYTLVFSDQPVKAMLFDPAKGDKGFLDDPVRVGYIRQAASALAAEGADVLVIPAGNPYLHQIFEALKTGLEEGAATTPVSPSLSGSADPQKDLFAFYSLLPEQLRRTAVDSNGDPGLPVYTDSPDEGLEKAFFEKFGRRLLFRDQAALAEEALTERPKKAYSYVI